VRVRHIKRETGRHERVRVSLQRGDQRFHGGGVQPHIVVEEKEEARGGCAGGDARQLVVYLLARATRESSNCDLRSAVRHAQRGAKLRRRGVLRRRNVR
jgi:hypothetical protein